MGMNVLKLCEVGCFTMHPAVWLYFVIKYYIDFSSEIRNYFGGTKNKNKYMMQFLNCTFLFIAYSTVYVEPKTGNTQTLLIVHTTFTTERSQSSSRAVSVIWGLCKFVFPRKA